MAKKKPRKQRDKEYHEGFELSLHERYVYESNMYYYWSGREVFPLIDDYEYTPWGEVVPDQIKHRYSDREQEILERALPHLTEPQREAFELFLDGYSETQIGRMLGLSQPAISFRLWGHKLPNGRTGGAVERIKKLISEGVL